MPNKLLGWNVETMSGNPTKPEILIGVINRVKKMEVCKQGKLLQTMRVLTIEEFKFSINRLKESNDQTKKYAVPSQCSFQFYLIVRIHGTCQFMPRDLMIYNPFLFVLCR